MNCVHTDSFCMRNIASYHCTAAIFLSSYDTSVLPGYAKFRESAAFCFKWRVNSSFFVFISRTDNVTMDHGVISPFITTTAWIQGQFDELLQQRTTSFPRRHCAPSSELPPKRRLTMKRSHFGFNFRALDFLLSNVLIGIH